MTPNDVREPPVAWHFVFFYPHWDRKENEERYMGSLGAGGCQPAFSHLPVDQQQVIISVLIGCVNASLTGWYFCLWSKAWLFSVTFRSLQKVISLFSCFPRFFLSYLFSLIVVLVSKTSRKLTPAHEACKALSVTVRQSGGQRLFLYNWRHR